MTVKSKSLVLLALLSVIWGSYFLLIEIADDSFPPLTIASVRLAIGAAVLYPLLSMQGQRLPKLGKAWGPLLVIGIFEALLTTMLVSLGESHISSALASVLFSTMPIFTVIVGYLWWSRPVTRNKVFGVLIGFFGALIVLGPSLRSGAGSGLLLVGAFAILMASLSKAFAALYSHRVLDGIEPVVVATGMMASAAAISLPLMFVLENPLQLRPSTESLLALITIGLASAAGFLIFFWLIKHRGPTFASIVRFNEPPIAILLAIVFTGGTLQPSTVIGMIVILLCVAVINGYLDPLTTRFLPHRAPDKPPKVAHSKGLPEQ